MIKKAKKIDHLIKKYDELKILPLIIYGSGAEKFYWFTVFMLLPAYLFLFRYLWTDNMLNIGYSFGFIIPGFVSHLLAVNKSNKYVKNNAKFRPYHTDFKLRCWAYSYESFISDYRFDKIKSEVRHLKYDAHIDDVISILEAEGVKIFDFMWKPVVILGAVLFPVIGEYVGFRYNVTLQANSKSLEDLEHPKIEIPLWIGETLSDGFDTLVDLLYMISSTGALVWLLVFIMEKMFLTKVNDRKNLIKLLKQIKMN